MAADAPKHRINNSKRCVGVMRVALVGLCAVLSIVCFINHSLMLPCVGAALGALSACHHTHDY